METTKTDSPEPECRVLAADLNSAIIPLPDNWQNEADLDVLTGLIDRHGVTLVYTTERGLAAATQVIEQLRLPQPGWLICEEGSSIFKQTATGQFIAVDDYPYHQDHTNASLPTAVSRAHALAWWAEYVGFGRDAIVFAGDDLDVLTAGCRAIVVGNADRSIAQEAYEAHLESGWRNRLCLARGQATSGVLEGCRWFGLVEPASLCVNRFGATPVTHNQTHFRVWAPRRQRVTVEVEETGIRHELTRQSGGCFVGDASGVGPGSRYRYSLDDEVSRPDPASDLQPDGVHGPSQIVDHRAFPWTDQEWPGVRNRDLIIYELHIGAFTKEGTFRAAIARLPELLALGVTAIELMPVAQSPGRWNWGYDGVDLFAVRNSYGEPDDLKALVDACHGAGLAVLHDVVYNHVGPEGNYLAEFGPFFSQKHHTPWGEAFNFDGHEAEHVRQFIVANAIFWLETYHFDGLRLDAVHFIQDDSDVTILDEIRRAVSEYSRSAGRTVHLIAETNVYDSDLLNERENQPAYDAIWCDCLMYSIYAHALPDLRLTHREYQAGDLAAALKQGWVFAGRKETRAAPQLTDRVPSQRERRHVGSLVIGLQTHDSVGHHPHGKRIHQLTSKAFQRAAAALTMLYPGVPLLFMGEEFAIESPFPFFVDFEDPHLRRAVDEGRVGHFPHHIWGEVKPPSDPTVFFGANCDDASRKDLEMFAWYHDLINLRKRGIAEGWLAIDRLSTSHREAEDVFVLRFTCEQGGRVSVHARLADPAKSELATVPFEGSPLLSSEPDPCISDGWVSLQRNHVVISKT